MRLMWGTLLGGGGFFVQNDTRWKIHENGPDGVLDLMGFAARFFHEQIVGFDYFTPDGAYSTSGISFINGETEFVLYSQTDATVKAYLASGETFLINFFNPLTGTFDPNTITIVGQGKGVTLSKPTNGDWLAWVVAE